MFSIYTSAYNLESGIYDWRQSLLGFIEFSDEVVVATFKSQTDNSVSLLEEFSKDHPKVKVILCDLSQDDPEFDGKLKNEALKNCTKDFCILLDLDEVIPISQKENWTFAAQRLGESTYDALMIPVIDLYNSESEYKSYGTKWYIHKNFIGLERGVVKFARKPDGSIDTNRSDTTELLKYGNLCNAVYSIDPRLKDEDKLNILRQNPMYVLHYGWLFKDKRKLAQKFWEKVWNNRAKREIDTTINFQEIKYKNHNLF